jgi:hypothetical protein
MIGLIDKLRANLWQLLAAIAVLALAVQTVRIEGAFCRQVGMGEKPACIVQGYKQKIAAIRIDLEAVRRDRDAERANHQATRQAYQDAQAEAQRLEAARLARVTAQQKEITDDLAHDYARRIAAARAAAGAHARRMRSGAGEPAVGRAAGAGDGFAMRDVSEAAGGADGAAGDHELPADQRLIATEQAIRLDALQSWVRQQQRVDPNR